MFKGMHPVFWIGLAIMYGVAIVFWIYETALPGSVYDVQWGGVASAFYYGTFLLVGVNIFLAWLWYYVPEQVDKKKEMELAKGDGKSGLSS